VEFEILLLDQDHLLLAYEVVPGHQTADVDTRGQVGGVEDHFVAATQPPFFLYNGERGISL
jgi:hypothetical protein